MRKYVAEFIGTCALVLFGTGVAYFSGGDLVATSLAFGLSIIAMAYVIGNVSGCHLNPAVSFAMLLRKEMDGKEFACYVVSQVLGAILGTGILYFLLINMDANYISYGVNGYGSLSNTNITLAGAAITEIVLTFIFIFTILGVTSDKEKSSVSGIVIGLTLTFVHLLGINLTGTSVNPARSLAPALFAQGEALSQVWVFIVFPLVGSALAVMVFNKLNEKKKKGLF